MKSIGKKESKQSYLIISKTLKRHYLNIWSRLWLWAKTQLITDLNIEKMETIKPKQVISTQPTFHPHSTNTADYKQYQSRMHVNGMLRINHTKLCSNEDYWNSRCVMPQFRNPLKQRKKKSAHANANILHKNEYIKKKKKD